MSKVAVLMATGYEEGETLTIVDILRRHEIEVHTFYFGEDPYVLGMQQIKVKANQKFSDVIKEYDMIVLPGGRPGGMNLLENDDVIKMVQYFNDHHKFIGAMCSGTVVLEKADVIRGKNVTGYTNYDTKLLSGNFTDALVEVDDHLITSVGPATPYPFAYKLCELLGKDPTNQMQRTLYKEAKGKY